MSFFTKIKRRIDIYRVAVFTRLRNDRLDRADILLAHRLVARRRPPTIRQWRLMNRILKPGEQRLIRLAGYAIAVGCLLLIGRWLLTHAVLVPATGGEYREGIVGSPRAINPILAGSNDVDEDLVRLMFSGLYKRDVSGELVLDLAASSNLSADGKTYTFTLRPDAKFHDGQPVTAGDVVFTMKAIMDPAWKSPLAKNLQGVAAAALNAQTVVITCAQPSAFLPSLLTFGILPQHLWANIDPASALAAAYDLKPIGSGPYKFEEFSRDAADGITSYTVHSVPGSGAMLDRITFKFFDDYSTAADKLTGNSVDGLNFAPPAERAAIAAIPGIVMHAPQLAQYTALFLNPKNNPALADISIRQALALAIDRNRIIKDALGGLGTLRDAPIADPDTTANAAITRYAYDPAAAAALLDKAGYALDPETKIRTKTVTTPAKTKKDKPTVATNELAVTITTIDTDENRKAAEIIKDDWAALGVKTDIITAAAATINTSVIRPRSYDALLFGEILAPDADPYPFWHSSQITGGQNLAMYSDRHADELLEKARLAKNDNDRDALLAQFEQILTADVPAIFLYQPDYLYPQSSKIKGYNVQRVTAPADRFGNVTAWYRKLWVAFK